MGDTRNLTVGDIYMRVVGIQNHIERYRTTIKQLLIDGDPEKKIAHLQSQIALLKVELGQLLATPLSAYDHQEHDEEAAEVEMEDKLTVT